MDFSVIIPTYKDWTRLALCISCLMEQDSTGMTYEIIIVDNEPEHHPPENVRKNNFIKNIHESRPGSYAARNAGAKKASGNFLAFTDADCLPDIKWLNKANILFSKSNCDLIGGRIDLYKEEEGGNWAFIYEKNTSFRQDKHVPIGKGVTANLLIKRAAFEKLKGFDSSLNSGGDWEFTQRAVSEGYTMVYGDDVIVKHPARKSIRQLFKKQKRFAAWGFLKGKKYHGHSGLRIIGSNLLRNTPAAFKRIKHPESLNEKLIVLLISLQLHIYKVFLQLMFLTKIVNPEKIRE